MAKKKTALEKTSPLKFALDLEIKGVNMYLKLAEETKNLLGKKLFYSLAGEEVQHADKVDEIYNGLLPEAGSVETAQMALVPSIESEMKEFFFNAGKGEIVRGEENSTGYKLAIDLEKKSCEIYQKFLDEAKTDAEKKFFGEILNQEKAHLEAVINVYSYIKSTGDWLQEEESRVWNWMNI